MTTYEISVWEDYYDNDLNRYCERRLAIIGQSNMHDSGSKMDTQCRARDPKLVNNVNGTNTFTFTMYYSYVSNDTGEIEYNPYVPLLINERKIKVFWRDKWYDFVIKDMKKSSDKKTITYTCKDLFINELSKNGYNIEFADVLQNNMGTAPELAKEILKDTDWKVDEENSEIVEELREEAVYETITNLNDSPYSISIITHNYGEYSLEKDRPCLVFYSTFQNRNKFLQFVYLSEGDWETENDSILVTNGIKLNIEEQYITYQETIKTIDGIDTEYIQVYYDTTILLFEIPKYAQVSNDYRAERQVYQQLSKVDPKLNKVVDLYSTSINNKEVDIYKYSHTEFDDYTVIQNIAVNPSNFTNTKGWHASTQVDPTTVDLSWETGGIVPNQVTYLNIPSSTPKTKIINTGIENNYNSINGHISKGQKYVFRLKRDGGRPSDFVPYVGVCSILSDGTYTYTNSDEYFTFGARTISDGYLEWIGTCNKDISIQDIQSETTYCIGFTAPSVGASTTIKIYDLQFYRLVEYTEGGSTKRINPGEVDQTSLKKTVEYYYLPENSAEKVEDIKEPWVDTIYDPPGISQIADKPNFVPQMNYHNGKYERIRSIKGEKSNRYNLLQTLAETFQCWVRFEIEHDENGAIVYRNNRYQKNIVFKKDIGGDTGIIFSKGIDLKSLSQNYNSDQLVTKVIVAENPTTIAPSGICTIQRANENPSKDSFILNFDYYVSQGLLNRNEINEELYDENISSSDNLPIGFLPKLKALNETYDNANIAYRDAYLQKLDVESLKKVYWEDYLAAIDELQEKKGEYLKLSGHNWGEIKEGGTVTSYNCYLVIYNGQSYIYNGNTWDSLPPNMPELNSSNAQIYAGTINGSMFDQKIALISEKTSIYRGNYSYPFISFQQSTADPTIYSMRLRENTGTGLYSLTSVVVNTGSDMYPTAEELKYDKIKGIHGSILDLQVKIANLFALTNENEDGTYDEQLKNLNNILTTSQATKDNCLRQKTEVELAFWNKYSRFIQEGTWNSSDYYDDNLYYLAAENVLRTSSKPQFKFDINVISLESLDEFKLKKAHVGDIGYVEDVEFLGMTPDNLQPRRERVLISETTFNLDSPQKDAIKVQNYKTRFEDLFQRITASTESLKAQEGSFARTASQFSDDGSLKLQVLQEALTKGSSSLNFASTNDCVVKDETGITVVDTINRGNQLKVTSGGILMTEDGRNWTKVVGAQGVRPEALREGSIQADEITIMNENKDIDGKTAGFRWTGEGIVAYTDISNTGNNFVKTNMDGITMASGSSALSLPSNPTWNDYLANNDIKVRIDRATGNVKVKGDIYADNGYFNGVVNATGGIFSGNIGIGSTLLFKPQSIITKKVEGSDISFIVQNPNYFSVGDTIRIINDDYSDFKNGQSYDPITQEYSTLESFVIEHIYNNIITIRSPGGFQKLPANLDNSIALNYGPSVLWDNQRQNSSSNYYYFQSTANCNFNYPYIYAVRNSTRITVDDWLRKPNENDRFVYTNPDDNGNWTLTVDSSLPRPLVQSWYSICFSPFELTIPCDLSNLEHRALNTILGINGSITNNIIPAGALSIQAPNGNLQMGRKGLEATIYGQNYYIDGATIDCGTW